MRNIAYLSAFIAFTLFAPALACEALPEVGLNPQPQTSKTIHSCFAWIRLTPSAVPITAAYVHIHNLTDWGDVFVSASSPLVERVELHETKTVDGIATMRPLPNGVEIPKGSYLEMRPGGIHIMLMGVKEPLKEGQKIPITLNFVKRVPLTIEATVMKSIPAATNATVPEHTHSIDQKH